MGSPDESFSNTLSTHSHGDRKDGHNALVNDLQPRIRHNIVVLMCKLLNRACTSGSRHIRSGEHCVHHVLMGLLLETSPAPSSSSLLAVVCLCRFGIVRGHATDTKKVVTDAVSLVVLLSTHLLSVNSTPTNTARTELHSMITFHQANTRGSRAGRLRIAHLCVSRHLSSTCHVSFLCRT